ncbi:MepB family protein [Viridibacillus arvi]|uniref:MepB family protein n=1 Tax=Viridibacillus arvi TaxID=263475 RepID=UPI00187BC328|nr:MepB family protein [Viridibacillus sp. JNUCC-6]QOV12455.1 MepB family protein [Viridibacillus sp. JNUCC-6]
MTIKFDHYQESEQINKKNRQLSAVESSRQNSWTDSDAIHENLIATKKLVYNSCGFVCSQPLIESQNAAYGAYVLKLNNLSIRFRVAKITPTKIGQFVTLWERVGDGSIQPYDVSDSVDFFVISVKKDDQFGQFVFPKAVLCKQDIISNKGQGGKRAIRVYPPWDKPISRQAKKTQEWQLKYFLEIPRNTAVDCVRAKALYNLKY